MTPPRSRDEWINMAVQSLRDYLNDEDQETTAGQMRRAHGFIQCVAAYMYHALYENDDDT